MVPANAPRLNLFVCRNEVDREFLEALNARAERGGWTADSWPREDRALISFDVESEDCIIQTLRIDFDGTTVIFGPNETCQLVTDLDPNRHDVCVATGSSPAILASVAADWLEREMNNPLTIPRRVEH